MANTTIIAIAGITATALTALLGLGLQWLLFWRAAKTARHRRAYDDAPAIYADVGRVMSEATQTFLGLVHVDAAGRIKSVNSKALKDYTQSPIYRSARHSIEMLRMHAAPATIMESRGAWQTAPESMANTAAEYKTQTNSEILEQIA